MGGDPGNRSQPLLPLLPICDTKFDQRQQTKWVVYSLAVTIILGIGLYAIPALIFRELGPNGSLFSSVANILANVLLILLPISFGVAILRYRLWDVDVLINKTLV